MSKFKSVWSKTLKLNWRQSKTIQVMYKGKFTKEEIRKFGQKMSNDMAKKGTGIIEIAILYPEEWYSGYFTKWGDAISLFDYSDSGNDQDDPEYFDRFCIYYIKTAGPAGGCDNGYNDCFWQILHKILGDKNPYETPYSLKKALHIKNDALVTLDHIDTIERGPKNNTVMKAIGINVTGDYIRTSAKKGNLQIHMVLELSLIHI